MPRFDAERPPVLRGALAGATAAIRCDGRIHETTLLATGDPQTWQVVWPTDTRPGPGSIELSGRSAMVMECALRAADVPALAGAVASLEAGAPEAALRTALAALEGLAGQPEQASLAAQTAARAALRLGRAKEAAALYARSAAAAREAGLPNEAAGRERAAVFAELRRPDVRGAAAALERAASLDAALALPIDAALLAYSQALVARDTADLRAADVALERASTLLAEAAAPAERLDAICVRAGVFVEMGRFAEARDLLEGALPLPSSVDAAARARHAHNLAWALLSGADAGIFPEGVARALPLLASAAENARAAGDAPRLGNALVEQARALALQNDAAGAEALLAGLSEASLSAEARAVRALLRAGAALRRGDASGAAAAAQALLETPDVHGLHAEAARLLGDAERSLLHPAAAAAAYARAMGAARRLVMRGPRLSGGPPRLSLQRRVVEAQIELSLAAGEPARAAAAVAAALRTEAEALQLRAVRAGLDAAHRAALDAATDTYEQARARISELHARAGTTFSPGARAALAQQIAEAERAVQRAAEALPQAGADALAPAPDLPIVEADTVAILGFAGSGGGHLFRLEGARVEHRLAASLAEAAPWLFALPEGARAVVVPGGLPETPPGGPASLVAVMGPGGHTLASHVALRFAPDLRPRGPLSVGQAGASVPGEEAPVALIDPTLDLASAEAEGDALTALLPGLTLRRGAAATRAAWLDALARPLALHFAGHGDTGTARPWDAHLRLAGGERFTLEDALTHEARARLVVLNGCATGRPVALAPALRVGLAEALLLAGAGAVLATVRDVDDAAALRFVRRFYAQGGLTDPGEALRRVSAEPAFAKDFDAFRLFERMGGDISPRTDHRRSGDTR